MSYKKSLIVYSELVNKDRVVSKNIILKYYDKEISDEQIFEEGLKIKKKIKQKFKWEEKILNYKLHIRIVLSD